MFKYFNTNKNMRKNKATILVIKIRIKLLKYEWKISTGQNSGYDKTESNINKADSNIILKTLIIDSSRVRCVHWRSTVILFYIFLLV